jgi:hypothetical protein
VGRYEEREGEIAGEVRIVKGWHALGHPVRPLLSAYLSTPHITFQGLDKVVPTSEFIGTGKSFQATSRVVQSLQPLSYRVNALLEHLDPSHYAEAQKVRDALRKHYPGFRALSDLDPLVYEGRELLFNRTSGEHTDRQDPPLAWAILAAFGDFAGGDVFIKSLGLRIRLEPGDCIAIRGRVVPHEVLGDYTGQRISIPHFTHSLTWNAVGNTTVFV